MHYNDHSQAWSEGEDTPIDFPEPKDAPDALTLSDVEKHQQIEWGGQGIVYLATLRPKDSAGGFLVAIKRGIGDGDGVPQTWLREIALNLLLNNGPLRPLPSAISLPPRDTQSLYGCGDGFQEACFEITPAHPLYPLIDSSTIHLFSGCPSPSEAIKSLSTPFPFPVLIAQIKGQRSNSPLLAFDYCPCKFSPASRPFDLTHQLFELHKQEMEDRLLLMSSASQNIVRYTIFHLLRALALLHSQNIVHRDVKRDNVLLRLAGWKSGDGTLHVLPVVKLSDLGSARVLKGAASRGSITPPSIRTTLLVRPPETLDVDPVVSHSGDIWGAGVVFAELLLVLRRSRFPNDKSSHLFHVRGELQLVASMIELLGDDEQASGIRLEFLDHEANNKPLKPASDRLTEIFGSVTTPEGLDLLRLMLNRDPARRPDAVTLLSHSYFSKVIDNIEGPSGMKIALSHLSRWIAAAVAHNQTKRGRPNSSREDDHLFKRSPSPLDYGIDQDNDAELLLYEKRSLGQAVEEAWRFTLDLGLGKRNN